MRRVSVSTRCPMCGAPIDFHAGINALQCTHCRSNLLVTGRKQLLSYSVTPRIGAHDSVERAKPAAEGARLVTIELYFVPYYRFTAQEFCWGKPDEKPKEAETPSFVMPPPGPSTSGEDLVESAVDWFSDLFFPKPRYEYHPSPRLRVTRETKIAATKMRGDIRAGDLEILERHVDKTFVANAELEGKNLYSIGARSSVLRLDLFRRKRLETMGRIVAPTISPDEAAARGVKRTSPDILHREVVGRVLSLIYFPYWVVEIDREGSTRLVVIDGVSGTIVQPDAPASLYEILNRKEERDPDTLGFRPLRCPNCRDDLAMHPEDVVFLCGTCQRAWQLTGDEMFRVAHRVAAPPRCDFGERTLLPFWILGHEAGKRFFIPAFKYGGLKALYQLAARVSAANPVYEDAQAQAIEAYGCYYDEEDALRLARLAYIGLARSADEVERLAATPLPISSAVLTWFPFERRGEMLLDPFLGQMLYARAMR